MNYQPPAVASNTSVAAAAAAAAAANERAEYRMALAAASGKITRPAATQRRMLQRQLQPAPEVGPGWRKENLIRQGGKHIGQKYHYFYSPLLSIQCVSLVQAQKLKAAFDSLVGTADEGDEMVAKEMAIKKKWRPQCSVDGCNRLAVKKCNGMCTRHWNAQTSNSKVIGEESESVPTTAAAAAPAPAVAAASSSEHHSPFGGAVRAVHAGGIIEWESAPHAELNRVLI